MHRWDVYRGRRTRSLGWLPSLLLFLLVFAVLAAITIFFALPSYLVYTKDSVALELPFLSEAVPTEEPGLVLGPELNVEAPQESEAPQEDYSQLTAELVVKNPDYSSMSYTTGEGLEIVQSVYIPYENANENGIVAAVAQARNLEIKALTMELRDESGMLSYASSRQEIINYALSGTWDMKSTIQGLKEQGYYLTAVISTCVDNTWASRNAPATLKDSAGFPYSDHWGAWMDPWSSDVREMTVIMAAELMEMGFDEVVLNHVEHPVANVQYSRVMSGELTRVACVTNFAMAVREGLEDTIHLYGARLSAMMDPTALNDEDVDNGQRLDYFLRIFDRVYEFTETYEEASYVVGLGIDSTERFVPIISWVFPGASWAQNYFAEAEE